MYDHFRRVGEAVMSKAICLRCHEPIPVAAQDSTMNLVCGAIRSPLRLEAPYYERWRPQATRGKKFVRRITIGRLTRARRTIGLPTPATCHNRRITGPESAGFIPRSAVPSPATTFFAVPVPVQAPCHRRSAGGESQSLPTDKGAQAREGTRTQSLDRISRCQGIMRGTLATAKTLPP